MFMMHIQTKQGVSMNKMPMNPAFSLCNKVGITVAIFISDNSLTFQFDAGCQKGDRR